MNKSKMKNIIINAIVLLLFLVGCSITSESNISNNITSDSLNQLQSTNEVIDEIVENNKPDPTESVLVSATPTPDLRTPPTEWMDYPIVPEITTNAITIHEMGLLNGVYFNTFSKIGDCQNIKEAFLGIYDTERYFLVEEDSSLQDTIENFKGFFNRDGEAIEQGLNVAAALSPLHANPDVCGASESPLDCELRTANPIFAFISFERWWPNETPPEVYEKYLHIVIQKTIDHGTIPILVTKADNIEGNHQINQIIANLAFEYDIPLYNWWKAAQFLPHRGMDPERNDGFHISIEAWDSRSYFGLKTLDSLWKGIQDTI